MSRRAKKPTVLTKVFRSILFGRFEPIETVLATSAIIHGLWLLFPYWGADSGFSESITGASRAFELVIGLGIAILGMIHLASMAWFWKRVRRQVAFIKFIFWGFLAYLSIIALGFHSVLWIPYITIMLVSGVIYLNISIGVANE